MKSRTLRTPQQVLDDFTRKGISIASWARANNLPRSVVYGVLNGTRKTRFGQGHKAAVLLGLKDGEIVETTNHDKT